MANPALASLSDLEARGVDTSDATRAQAALLDASALIHLESNSRFIDPATGALVADVPAVLNTICCKVAQRVLTNPAGVVTESIAGYSVNYGDAYLRQTEVEQIRQTAGLSGLGLARLAAPWAPPKMTVTAFLDGDVDDGDVFYGS